MLVKYYKIGEYMERCDASKQDEDRLAELKGEKE